MSLSKTYITVGALVLTGVGFALLLSSGRTLEQETQATVENVPYQVSIITPKRIVVGDTASVRIRVRQNGRPVDIDAIGRMLHVMVVSANVQDSFHTYNPVPEGQGVYSIEHTFTEPGKYRIWTEVDNIAAAQRHDQYAERIGYAEIALQASAPPQAAVAPVTERTVGSYRVRLITAPIVAGRPATLRVEVTDKNGRTVPLSSVEPFLYFISGNDFTFFRHGHGHPLPDGSGSLENIFPVPGQYVFWVQLEGEHVNGIQVPLIFTVS